MATEYPLIQIHMLLNQLDAHQANIDRIETLMNQVDDQQADNLAILQDLLQPPGQNTNSPIYVTNQEIVDIIRERFPKLDSMSDMEWYHNLHQNMMDYYTTYIEDTPTYHNYMHTIKHMADCIFPGRIEEMTTERKRNACAIKIQKRFRGILVRNNISNPENEICKKRLMLEYNKFIKHINRTE